MANEEAKPENKPKPVSVDLNQLVERLRSMGMEITKEELVLDTNPALETQERIDAEIQIQNELFAENNYKMFDKDESYISLWQSLDLKYRLNRYKK